ncbi:MAG: hypothetical protein R3268_00585 [Acidiferrobacterales bacterium]|nr:hypothetical protein [Acidiferrobacterales bacterium]
MFDARRLSTRLTTISVLWFVMSSFTAEGQRAPSPESGVESMNPPDAPASVNLWQPGDPGEPLQIHGWVRSTDGKPIVGAIITIWQADATGTYYDDRYRASLRTGKGGRYRFNTVLPGQYYSAKHIHIAVTHADYEAVVTRILFKGDPNLDEFAAGELAIPLEKGTIKGKTVLFGRFDILLQPMGSS